MGIDVSSYDWFSFEVAGSSHDCINNVNSHNWADEEIICYSRIAWHHRSDNAINFTSEEFAEFVKKNGIEHVKTAPYHPALNGMVERVFQTFKEGMKKMQEGTIQTKLP